MEFTQKRTHTYQYDVIAKTYTWYHCNCGLLIVTVTNLVTVTIIHLLLIDNVISELHICDSDILLATLYYRDYNSGIIFLEITLHTFMYPTNQSE